MANYFSHWFKSIFKSTQQGSSQKPFNLADFTPSLTTQLLVLQPTPFCNLDCDYCYLPRRNSRARMSLDTIRQTAQRLLEDGLLGQTLTVVWHAGEPLVMPPSYYEAAFTIFADTLDSVCQVSHSIQTNATLINDEWCLLFQKFQVRIGVSIDGPQHINDRHRKTRQGKGSYELILKGMETLRRNQIPFHVISVITVDSLRLADELHDFFVSQGIREVAFNFDEAEGPNVTSSLQGQEQAHYRFYQRMLEHTFTTGGQYQIRELSNVFRLIAQRLPHYLWQGEAWPGNSQTMPFSIISVAWNGDFSTFSPELLGQMSSEFNDFVLGNVSQSSFLQAADSQNFFNLWHQIQEGTAACQKSCAYFNYCGGGAPANKLYENGSFNSAETLYCRAMIQRPFEVVLQKLEQDAPEKTNHSILAAS
ncbi:putative arylsulfatase regulatory protein [Crenothrix polyspora]|uniref:Putative arylsulfatase regulatory protein n=1 Tax=Crenothrix polyspora TaxID=360316 RepID=A0A1R4H6Y0_9GAMM|nr:cyclophane-forming radical SAM/SPASM peptide maturase GrrM/OscB [Crenothrix polyspora]SJM91949.1 putative arylsulfatase regulatory protein [Crenothrix polyspora]